jgi:protein O-GlcNAc transferase
MTDLSTIQLLLSERKLHEAESACQKILSLAPNDAAATHLLGLIISQRGIPDEACRVLRRSIELDPTVSRFHTNLAGVLGSLGRHDLALEHLNHAIRLEPGSVIAHHNFGVALAAVGRLTDAFNSYGCAIKLSPAYAPAYNHLGNALRQQGRIDDALAAHQQGVSLAPNPDALQQLAATLWERGDQQELIGCYRQVMNRRPTSAVHSSLIFAMHHDPAYTPKDKLQEAIAWNSRHASTLSDGFKSHTNDRSPDRRLRIGYVAPDFISQPGARIILPILRAHDRSLFEAVCYSGGPALRRDSP